MATPFRPPRPGRSAQPRATAATCPPGMPAADRATGCPNAATLGQTESGLAGATGDLARAASTGLGQAPAFAAYHQTGLADSGLGGHTPHSGSRLLSQTAGDRRRHPPRLGLDLSLSRRW